MSRYDDRYRDRVVWVPENLTAPVPENLAAFRNGAMDDPAPQSSS